jgi:zinc transport system substrate-binding protein
MKHFKKIIAIAIFIGMASLGTVYAASPLPVFVSIPPQKYFVEKIGGALVSVSVMVGPGANPHNYEPRPNQMTDLTKARIYFAVGIGFEDAWLSRFANLNPTMRIVHTDEGIEKLSMVPDDHHKETHGGHSPTHENNKATKDPHVWLSPLKSKIIARNILKALQEQDPSNTQFYENNYRVLIQEIENLDGELRGLFANKKGMKFIVFHPAWGYFARDYDLVQIPIEVEGKEPKPAQLKDLIKFARKEGITVIFVQPQFSARSAQTIAKEIGGRVVIADDLAADWARNLRNQGRAFLSASK